MSTKTVLLTGVSGFIALHIFDELLKKNYKVIGTVRSQSKADRIEKEFTKLYPKGNFSFEIVQDIGTDGAFDDLFQNNPSITEVIHTASPLRMTPTEDLYQAFVVPATNGTENVLNAVKSFAPQVQHVVITSSFASIRNLDKIGDKSFIHTEETWNPMEWEDATDTFSAYTYSKKSAELAARKFVEENEVNFTLTTINPPYVFGPQMFYDEVTDSSINTSSGFIVNLLNVEPNDTSFQEDPSGLAIDVRDVATLHVLPLEQAKFAGKRLLPISGPFNGQLILNFIHQQFPELDGKVGKGDPTGVQKNLEDHSAYYDITRTHELTGIKDFIPLENTLKDTFAQVLAFRKGK